MLPHQGFTIIDVSAIIKMTSLWDFKKKYAIQGIMAFLNAGTG
jgi:hypothetical protein